MVRRLWDSWEDDAIIRDVTTGRYVDRDKLHYIDFTGKYFSVKGPSITPRPPQGQPVVAALAHAGPRTTNSPPPAPTSSSSPRPTAARYDAILDEVHAAGGTELKVFADVVVTFGGDGDFRLRCARSSRAVQRNWSTCCWNGSESGHRRCAAAAGRQRHRSPGDRRRGGAVAAASRAVPRRLRGTVRRCGHGSACRWPRIAMRR